MWKPSSAGVLLQRIDSPENHTVLIKLVRENKSAGQQHEDRFNAITAMTLHINNETKQHKLEFDPWSDINVIPDGSIDEKDINAITQLALAFYHQKEVEPDVGIFLALIPVDTPRRLVRIEILDVEDNEQPVFDYFLNATSFDEGANFVVRRVNPHTGPSNEDSPGLEDLAKAFFKLKI